MEAAIVGMERVAELIGRCAIYEQLYLAGDIPKNAGLATDNLRKGLLTLYTTILQALCRLIRLFEGRTPIICPYSPCANSVGQGNLLTN